MATEAIVALTAIVVGLVGMVGASVMLAREYGVLPPVGLGQARTAYLDAKRLGERTGPALVLGFWHGVFYVAFVFTRYALTKVVLRQLGYGQGTWTSFVADRAHDFLICGYGPTLLVIACGSALTLVVFPPCDREPGSVLDAILGIHVWFILTCIVLLPLLMWLSFYIRFLPEGFAVLYALGWSYAVPGLVALARERRYRLTDDAEQTILLGALTGILVLLGCEAIAWFRYGVQAIATDVRFFGLFLLFGVCGAFVGYLNSRIPDPDKPIQVPKFAKMPLRKLIGGGVAWLIGGIAVAKAPPGVFYPWMTALAVVGFLFTFSGLADLLSGTFKAIFNPDPTLENSGVHGTSRMMTEAELEKLGHLND